MRGIIGISHISISDIACIIGGICIGLIALESASGSLIKSVWLAGGAS